MGSSAHPTRSAAIIGPRAPAGRPHRRRRATVDRVAVALAGLLASLVAPSADAEEALTGRGIMEWVDARDDGDLGVSDIEMILIDKRGNERVRTLRSYTRDVGDDEQTMMFFMSPADVKDTGFLTYDYDDPSRDDDQWLYLPALKKSKRIAGGDKSGSFMGSDFSYADMASRALDRYTYTLMKETAVDGVPVWQIEAIPNEKEIEETGTTRSILFVRQDIHLVVRSVSWLTKGGRLKYFEAEDIRQVDGVWVPHLLTMKTTKGKSTLHRTVIHVSNVKFGQDLDEQMFTVRRLEKGL
jgi:hypothetical protein